MSAMRAPCTQPGEALLPIKVICSMSRSVMTREEQHEHAQD